MYLDALKLAYQAHDGQTRKQSCVPYIIHPVRVANCFNDDFSKTVAVLHDVIEDTSVTKELIAKKFNDQVAEIVDFLSKKEDESHFDYIWRIKGCGSNLAIEIKVADIIDNLSDAITVVQTSMCDRYNKSLQILLS